jgi:hypothetical protein
VGNRAPFRRLPETLPEIPSRDSQRDGFDLSEEALRGVRYQPLPKDLSLEGDERELEESATHHVTGAWDEVFDKMQEAVLRQDYERALQLVSRFLAYHPSDPVAKECAEEYRAALELQLEVALPMSGVLVAAMPVEQLCGLLQEPRAVFLLSRMDGMLTLEELVDVSAMPRLEALRLLREWIEMGYIALRD